MFGMILLKYWTDFVLQLINMSLRQFHMCIFCGFKVCDYLLWPREIVDDRCSICKVRNWYCYGGPVDRNSEENRCFVHVCASCGCTLCFCTIASLWGRCPRCSLSDKWVALPPGLIAEDVTVGRLLRGLHRDGN